MEHAARLHADTMAILTSWHQWLRGTYAPATVKLYWNTVWLFFKGTTVAVPDVTPEHVDAWLALHPYRSWKRRTYYQALVCFFRWAKRRRYIRRDPTADARIPAVEEKVPESLSEEEVAQLAITAAMHPGARARMRPWAILLLYYTGARIGEATSLQWDDVMAGQLRVSKAKGGRQRFIPISPKLSVVLASLAELRENDRILPRRPMTVWSWLKDAARDGSEDGEAFRRVYPHLLRSTFVTTALRRAEAPHALNVVKDLAGHRNVKTTMRYWAFSDTDKQRVAELL